MLAPPPPPSPPLAATTIAWTLTDALAADLAADLASPVAAVVTAVVTRRCDCLESEKLQDSAHRGVLGPRDRDVCFELVTPSDPTVVLRGCLSGLHLLKSPIVTPLINIDAVSERPHVKVVLSAGSRVSSIPY